MLAVVRAQPSTLQSRRHSGVHTRTVRVVEEGRELGPALRSREHVPQLLDRELVKGRERRGDWRVGVRRCAAGRGARGGHHGPQHGDSVRLRQRRLGREIAAEVTEVQCNGLSSWMLLRERGEDARRREQELDGLSAKLEAPFGAAPHDLKNAREERRHLDREELQ